MKLFDFVLARNGIVQLDDDRTADARVRVVRRGLRAGAQAGRARHRADQRALRAGFKSQGVRRDDRAPVVSHRAGRGGEDRAGDGWRGSVWWATIRVRCSIWIASSARARCLPQRSDAHPPRRLTRHHDGLGGLSGRGRYSPVRCDALPCRMHRSSRRCVSASVNSTPAR